MRHAQAAHLRLVAKQSAGWPGSATRAAGPTPTRWPPLACSSISRSAAGEKRSLTGTLAAALTISKISADARGHRFLHHVFGSRDLSTSGSISSAPPWRWAGTAAAGNRGGGYDSFADRGSGHGNDELSATNKPHANGGSPTISCRQTIEIRPGLRVFVFHFQVRQRGISGYSLAPPFSPHAHRSSDPRHRHVPPWKLPARQRPHQSPARAQARRHHGAALPAVGHRRPVRQSRARGAGRRHLPLSDAEDAVVPRTCPASCIASSTPPPACAPPPSAWA